MDGRHTENLATLPSWAENCVVRPREGVQAFLEDLCNRSGARYAHIRAISSFGKFYTMADSIGPYSGIGWRRRFRLLDSRDLHALAYSFSDYRNSADYRNLAEKYRLGSDQRSFLNSLKFGLLIPLTCSDINLGYVTLSWTEGTPNLAIAAELRSYVESIQATVPLLYSACRSIITDNNLVAFWAAAGTIVSSQSEALCYENIALACLQLWPDSTTYVGRIDPNASGAVIVAVEGRWKEEADQERQRERQIIPFGEGQFGYALTRNEPVISFSLADDNRFTYHSLRENNEYLGSGIAMKLSGLNGEPIAVMSVEHDIKNYFDPEDLRYITGIASLGYEALTVHKETAAILSRDIDTLFTQMLHDVTEPLQAIIADADVLRYEASIEPPKLADDELVKRLDNISVRAANIVEGSLNLYGQVRNLIDAGIEGASTRVTAGRVNLFRLLNSLVDTWGDRAALQGVEIRSLFDSLRGIEVQCDETELLSALGHLIGNAIKYSFWGRRHGDQSGATKYGRYVSIVGRITLSNVLIEIQNYGIGILPSELRRVKEKFYRGHLAIKEGRAGTGRGRWSAEAFFSSIGGRVDVASLYKSSDPTTTNGPYSTTVTAVMPYITSRRNS